MTRAAEISRSDGAIEGVGRILTGYLPFLLPILLQILCVVHAVRNGHVFPWIYVIVFLPLVGCIAYLLVIILPEMASTRAAAQVRANARNIVDPHRGLRQAHRAAEMVGSVDAKRALAEEYIARGAFHDAVEIYRDTAQGQFKDDPAVLQGLARAEFLNHNPAGTLAALDALQAADPKFVSADAHLLYARALEELGRQGEALNEYKRLVGYFPGEEARARYGMLLQKTGDEDAAHAVYQQILKLLDGAPARYRKEQKEWGEIAKRGLK